MLIGRAGSELQRNVLLTCMRMACQTVHLKVTMFTKNKMDKDGC